MYNAIRWKHQYRKKGEYALDAKKAGEILIKLRGNKPREEVAEANGISLSALIKYETGQRTPRDEVKQRLASYYNRTVQYIFFN